MIYFAPNIDLSIVKFCTKLRFSCCRVVRKQTFFNSYSHLFLNHAYVHFLILRMNSLLFPKICVSLLFGKVIVFFHMQHKSSHFT